MREGYSFLTTTRVYVNFIIGLIQKDNCKSFVDQICGGLEYPLFITQSLHMDCWRENEHDKETQPCKEQKLASYNFIHYFILFISLKTNRPCKTEKIKICAIDRMANT